MQLGKDFMLALQQIEEEKGLPISVIVSSLEVALVSAYKKNYDGNAEAEVELDLENGEIHLYELVPGTSEGNAEGKKGEAPTRVEISPSGFGRIAAQTARQVIIQRLKDAERQIIYDEFSDRVGELVNGTIFKSEGDHVFVRLNDRTEAILPKEERINGERYVLGDRFKFYLLDVRRTTRGPRIVVSRTHPGLLRKLLELEVPEIQEGTIEIKGIVREAGTRSKVAVLSFDSNVDPVGACVGSKGSRIKFISAALHGERMDVIIWNSDPLQFIRNALSPARIAKIEPLLEEDRSVNVFVRPDQLSLAIGKSGQNVRLAARLTGWKIDIKVVEPERMPTLQDLFSDIVQGDPKELWEEE